MNSFEALEVCGLRWPRSGKLNCPKHNDKTPSLHLYQDSYYCFSCGATGDGYGLIAVLTGRSIKSVLREYGDNNPQRPSSETLRLVGPQAMQAAVRRSWTEMNAEVFRRLHEVFGDFQTDLLVEEIERMGERFDQLKDYLLGEGDHVDDPTPSVRDSLALIAEVRSSALEYLESELTRLTGKPRAA